MIRDWVKKDERVIILLPGHGIISSSQGFLENQTHIKVRIIRNSILKSLSKYPNQPEWLARMPMTKAVRLAFDTGSPSSDLTVKKSGQLLFFK